MSTIVFRGTKTELHNKLRNLVPILTGQLPDPGEISKSVLTAIGLTLLSHIQASFEKKSLGGADDLGIQWAPLSPVTLALRRKGNVGKAAYQKLQAEFSKLSPTRRALIITHYGRLQSLYEAGRLSSVQGAAARKHARRLAELMRPFISKTRYQTLVRELSKDLPRNQAERKALVGAYALILRDTGRLFASLSPQIQSPDRIIRVMPGAVSVGSNVVVGKGYNLLALHDSPLPRKKSKRTGQDRLPRRQVLPDKNKPMPESWIADMRAVAKRQLQQPALWLALLGDKASTV